MLDAARERREALRGRRAYRADVGERARLRGAQQRSCRQVQEPQMVPVLILPNYALLVFTNLRVVHSNYNLKFTQGLRILL